MGPKNQTAASWTAESSSTQDSNAQEELAAAQAEIAQLQAQLAAYTTPHSQNHSPDTLQLIAVLEALTQQLTDSPQENPERLKRSAKIADPPLLTDGVEPTFANWKLQMQDKLKVNADHYPTP
jgi:hypothetical protein